MKQLSKPQSALMLMGGLMMVVGACCFAMMVAQETVCWIFLVGAALFAVIQGLQTYEGNNMVVRRLKRIQTLADVFFVLAGISMVDTANHLLEPFFPDRISYLTYIYNKWVVLLLIAGLLELYTVLRISNELKEDEKLKIKD